jgi:hypothetical protein
MDFASRTLRPTRDHYPVPKSKGGRRTIVCCYTCNHLKEARSPQEWEAFMRENRSGWFNKRAPDATLPAEPAPPPPPAKPLPINETYMILVHGKAAWRAWKAKQGETL